MTANAEDFNLDDTGVEVEELTVEHRDLWPAKIVLDTTQRTFKLVWFETDPPRHTDIDFSLVESLQIIQQYEGQPPELQIVLKDDRKFLLDFGPQIRKTAQTFSVLAKTPMVDAPAKTIRIIPKPTPDRASPVLVIGSLNGTDVLLPPSASTIGKGPGLETPIGIVSIDTKSVDYIIKQNMGRFRPCFVKQSEVSRVSGRIDVKISLDHAGKVSEANIYSSSINNSLVENCVLHQVRGLSFTPPKEGEESITYPFLFSQ